MHAWRTRTSRLGESAINQVQIRVSEESFGHGQSLAAGHSHLQAEYGSTQLARSKRPFIQLYLSQLNTVGTVEEAVYSTLLIPGSI
jgi:hypothetical protein